MYAQRSNGQYWFPILCNGWRATVNGRQCLAAVESNVCVPCPGFVVGRFLVQAPLAANHALARQQLRRVTIQQLRRVTIQLKIHRILTMSRYSIAVHNSHFISKFSVWTIFPPLKTSTWGNLLSIHVLLHISPLYFITQKRFDLRVYQGRDDIFFFNFSPKWTVCLRCLTAERP